MALERIENYFNDIADVYDERINSTASGAEEYVKQTAAALPNRKNMRILDLGCGSGHELGEILRKNDTVHFTCIDLAPKMLQRLRNRYSDYADRVLTVPGDFLMHDCGFAFYDGVLSVMAMHYYLPEEKLQLYKRICAGLKDNGFFLLTDKFAPTANYEEFCRSEFLKKREVEHNSEGAHYHFDIPLTVANEAAMLFQAGFAEVKVKWAKSSTAVLLATK